MMAPLQTDCFAGTGGGIISAAMELNGGGVEAEIPQLITDTDHTQCPWRCNLICANRADYDDMRVMTSATKADYELAEPKQ